ncbi:MAG: UvrD-helicase domain-containing protein, partial [Methylocella sp.]
MEIPADTRGKQHLASNPNQSVWVSANAGSGKTHVLASRVIRLLLQGVAPARILCVTFTKAAAANMAARVFDTLALWTQLSGDELCAQIVAFGAPVPGSRELTAARRLFARTVETPGGLKIQTIHAFCERLLHLFPFEANVPARFEVPDDLRQEELLQRARREVLARANLDKGALGAAVQRVLDECGPEAFDGLIKEAMRHSAISRARWPQEPTEILRRSLGLTEGREIGAIEREMIENGIAPERWNGFAAVLDQGTKLDQDRARQFRQNFSAYRLVSSDGSVETCLDSYLAIFFTTNGTTRVSLVTKDLARVHPEIAAELRAEQV